MLRTWHGRQGEHRLGVANRGAHWHGSARQARRDLKRIGRNGEARTGTARKGRIRNGLSVQDRTGEAWRGTKRQAWWARASAGLRLAGRGPDGRGRRGIAMHGSAKLRRAGQSRQWREAFRHGPNRHGSDGSGLARQARNGGNGLGHGKAWPGLAQRGMACKGLARLGATRLGEPGGAKPGTGLARMGVTGSGRARLGLARQAWMGGTGMDGPVPAGRRQGQAWQARRDQARTVR
jgi:hypothetical protein